MPEFLTTTGISDRLQKIIRGAGDFLVLVSPYLQTNPKIRELLEQKSRSKTHIRVIYGKRDLQPGEHAWIDSLTSIELCFRETLHAKCYLNDKEALLTSMNLYQFSELHNDEWGILVPKRGDDSDGQLYRKIYEEAEHIAGLSEKIREVPRKKRSSIFTTVVEAVKNRGQDDDNQGPTGELLAVGSDSDVAADTSVKPADVSSPTSDPVPADASSEPTPEVPSSGSCIHCKTAVPFNPAKPYCCRCYQTWGRNRNENSQEAFCHLCGGQRVTTVGQPLCQGCYETYKGAFA